MSLPLSPKSAGQLASPEIKRRVKALSESAKAQGLKVTAIRMTFDGEITILDQSAVAPEQRGDELDNFV